MAGIATPDALPLPPPPPPRPGAELGSPRIEKPSQPFNVQDEVQKFLHATMLENDPTATAAMQGPKKVIAQETAKEAIAATQTEIKPAKKSGMSKFSIVAIIGAAAMSLQQLLFGKKNTPMTSAM